MNKKAFGKIFTLTLMTVIFTIILTSCGEKTPKFGERVKDYKGFKTLKEAKLIVKGNLTLQAFVPMGTNNKASTSVVTASNNGVTISLRMLDANTVKSVGGPEKYLEKFGTAKVASTTAVEENFNGITEKDGMVYTSKYTISKVAYKYTGSSKTEFIKKIDFEGKTYYAYGNIDIYEPLVNDDSEKMLEEMKTYYGLDIYHDSSKIKERCEYFAKNPPKYKKVFVGKYLVQIPEKWNIDNSVSSAQVKTYGPYGKASDRENIFIGSQYVASNVYKMSDSQIENYMKTYMERIFKDLKLTMKPTKASLDGTKAFSLVMKKGSAEFKGYFIVDNSSVLFVYVAGKGSVSSKLNEVVENAFEKLEYLRNNDSKSSSNV